MTETKKTKDRSSHGRADNEFDRLLGWLDPDNRERAVEAYLALRAKLGFFFRRFPDPDDLADRAIDRALRKISRRKVDLSGNAENYIMGIARFLALEKYRERRLVSLSDLNEIPDKRDQFSDHRKTEEQFELLENCLKRTNSSDRELFSSYYALPENSSAEEHRLAVARRFDLTPVNLRVKIYRIRKGLRKCIEKNMPTDRKK